LSIPSDVASYLAPDERVLEKWRGGEWDVFATNNRIILRKGIIGKQIVEASYAHISSIEYKSLWNVGQALIGAILIFVGLFLPEEFMIRIGLVGLVSFLIRAGSLIVGLILVLLSHRSGIKLHVVGRPDPISLPTNLEPMIKWIRQYKQPIGISPKCKFCGADINYGTLFCPKCGKSNI